MRTAATLAIAAGILACTSQARSVGQAVTVELRMDDGRTVNLYPASGLNRAYAEAVKGAGYRIVVRNTTSRRVGLVIAVDGRNIVSGAKSWLRNDERMYILEPHGTQEHAGWRTGQDRINRFFFTTADDSYAGRFDDTSAMGVVAVAVYPEVQRPPCPLPATAGAAQNLARKESRDKVSEAAAGTGYGREEYSPSRVVAFEPEAAALEKTYIKYEWRDTLRRLGVVRDGNRFWEGGYAPPPPRG